MKNYLGGLLMSKFMDTQKKIEKNVVAGYKAIENGVVSGYKKVEDTFVSGYKKIEDKFVTAFLSDSDDAEKGSKE